MKNLLKLFWRSLPINLKDFLRPNIVKSQKFLSSVLGLQYLKHPIGRVSAPYLNKYLLKRSFAQQGEDLILDKILTVLLGKDVCTPHTYVDVGAYDAIDLSVTYLLYLRGWRGIVFDPSSTTHKSFKRWRKRDTFIEAVVGREDCIDVEFFVPKASIGDWSTRSTKYPNLEKINDFDKLVLRQVNLNNELRRQGLKKIDVLNIDVEGAELEILKTLDFEFFKPSVIAVEIHGNDLEECLKSEEAQWILGKGYQFVGSAVITQFFARKDEIVV